MKTEQRIDELRRELVIAERENDDEKVSRLSNEQMQLAAQRKLMLDLSGEATAN
jgi:uncharacterized membrane protein (DUF106 family)